MAHIADNIYKVQELRYKKEKILTARTDHMIKKPPFFVYDSIFASGYPWNTISDKNVYVKKAALVATEAAFGMWVLWNTALLKIDSPHLYLKQHNVTHSQNLVLPAISTKKKF